MHSFLNVFAHTAWKRYGEISEAILLARLGLADALWAGRSEPSGHVPVPLPFRGLSIRQCGHIRRREWENTQNGSRSEDNETGAAVNRRYRMNRCQP
jgi:hypothetical protein